MTVYCDHGTSGAIKVIDQVQEERGRGKLLIGGDWNERIGLLGSSAEESTEEGARKSRDVLCSGEGRKLVEGMANRGLVVLNGNTKGDEEGEFTFIGHQGDTVIDYAWVEVENKAAIEDFEVVMAGGSDHLPMVMTVGKEGMEREGESVKRWRELEDWSPAAIEIFQDRLKDIELTGKTAEERLEAMVERIREAIVREKVKVRERGEFDWWNKECDWRSRALKKLLRKGKRGKADKTKIKKARKELEEAKERAREDATRKWEERVDSISNESEMWELINKCRKTRENISEEISEDEWRSHFMTVFEGEECEEEVKDREEKERGRIEFTDEEINVQMKKLKKGKAAGGDGLRNEVWKNGGVELRRELADVMKRIGKGDKAPRGWKKGVVQPIHKKGPKDEVKNYRGVTLMDTSYKLYAALLNERLKKEVEGKQVLSEGMAGFRKGRGTLDNIYIIKRVVDAEVYGKGNTVYACFVDLSAAFDKVNREKLWSIMRKKKIDENLVRKIEELYEDTTCAVRVNGKETKVFRTRIGVKQGCPLSPVLFNIFVSDLEEVLRRNQDGGMVIGKEKVWSLGYADDIVLLAYRAEELRNMIWRLKRYFDKKELILNAEKTKVMRFRKGKGRMKKEVWTWGEREFEEVKQFNYLGYILQSNNGNDKQLKEAERKGLIAMRNLWGVGERFFKNKWKIRWKLFDAVVRSIMLYGVECWGWREQEVVERMQERYARWLFGWVSCTPGYMVMEESKRRKLAISTGKRAMKFERKIRFSSGNKLLKECGKITEEIVRRKWKTPWFREREEFINANGGQGWNEAIRNSEIEEEKVVSLEEEISEKLEWRLCKERVEKLRKSRYNDRYIGIIYAGYPKYMRMDRKAEEVRMIARFRLGNEERICRYWLKDEEKACRLCGWGKEDLQHMRRGCAMLEKTDMEWYELLDHRGEGAVWMRKILLNRRKYNQGTLM